MKIKSIYYNKVFILDTYIRHEHQQFIEMPVFSLERKKSMFDILTITYIFHVFTKKNKNVKKRFQTDERCLSILKKCIHKNR